MSDRAITLDADFVNDVRLAALSELHQAGSHVDPKDIGDAFQVCRAYFNVLLKVISERPRHVHHSKELEARTPSLADTVQIGIRLIETLSIAGESLAAHQSDRAHRTGTHDWLLNDWGIHHLHLDPRRDSDDLLYVWVAPQDLYFLDVRGHAAMSDPALLEVVLANWPELLGAPMPIRGGEPISAAQYDEARRSGVQPLSPLSNGKTYFPRGGGVTTARGSSARAVDRADDILSRVAHLEKQCREHAAQLAEGFGTSEMRLRYDWHTDEVVELGTGKRFKAP